MSRRFFSDSVSEENITDYGEELVPLDLEADSSDSDNDIFIFIIGIHATSRIKLFLKLCLDSSCFAAATETGMWYDSMDYLSDKCISYLSKNVYVYCIIPSSLLPMNFF